jgi:WD40 repeat protein
MHGSVSLDKFDSNGTRVQSFDANGYLHYLVKSDQYLAFVAGNSITLINNEGKATTINLAAPAYIGDTSVFTDGNTFFYSANSTQVTRLTISDQSTQNVRLPSLGNDIHDVAYSPDGQLVAFSAANSIHIVHAATGTTEETIDLGASWAGKLVYTADGKLLAATSENKIGVWDLKVEKRLNDLDFGVPIFSFAVSPDGQLLAIGNADGVSIATLQEALAGSKTLTPLEGSVPQTLTSMTFSPDGRWLAAGFNYDYSGGFDNQYLFLWDIKNHTAAKAYENGFLGGAVSIAFSPDSKRIAAAGGYLSVWAVNKPPEPLYIIQGNGTLASAGYSPDGNWLISTDFVGLYARKTYFFRAADGVLRGNSQRPATIQGGGGGGDTVPAVPMAISSTQFAAVDNGGVISLRQAPDAPLESDAVGIMAYCDSLPGKPHRPKPDQSIAITWSWYAKTLEQVFDHMYAAYYEISVDGKPENIYSVFPDAIYRDPVNDNNWTVYYRLYTGPLAAGEHTIKYRVTWNRQISDGFDTFGPDSANVEQTGSCGFTVQ